MKKFISFFFTLIIALACNFCSKTYLTSLLNVRFPEYVSLIITAASVLVFCLIWVGLILRIKLRVYKIGRQRINWIWLLCTILIPAIYVFVMFFINGSVILRRIDFIQFAKTTLLVLAATVIINELTFRSLILNNFNSICGKTLSCILTSLIYGITFVTDFRCGFAGILHQITVPFVISVLLCLIAFQTESILSSIILNLVYSVSEVMIHTGTQANEFTVLFFKTNINTWIITAVKSAIFVVFIIIAVILLVKKRKEEVLYW